MKESRRIHGIKMAKRFIESMAGDYFPWDNKEMAMKCAIRILSHFPDDYSLHLLSEQFEDHEECLGMISEDKSKPLSKKRTKSTY